MSDPRPTVALAFVLLLPLAGAPIRALAALSERDYLRSLDIAQKKVERTRRGPTPPGAALSSSFLSRMAGTVYSVGDRWDVLSWRSQSVMARMTSEEERISPRYAAPVRLRYEVVEVKRGASPEITLRITQQAAEGLAPVDSRVESVTLRLAYSGQQTLKEYRFAGSTRAVRVASDGLHTAASPLELYPLDLPELSTAVIEEATSLPAVPPEAAELASRLGYQPQLAGSRWLEQEDFFGRPLQALWQTGNPWPTFIKTANGLGLLINVTRAASPTPEGASS